MSTNARGERVVYVYHGGAIPDGAAFDISKVKSWGVLGRGGYFTADEGLAVEYAKKAAADRGTARVVRLEIPVGDLEGQTRVKLLAAPLGTLDGVQFDGAMILNVTGFDAAHTSVYGAFTDMTYLNALPRKTVQTIAP